MPALGSVLARLALLLGSTLICVTLAELGLRLHAAWTGTGSLADLAVPEPLPAPGSPILLGHIIELHPNERIVYALRPGLDVVFRDSRLRTNARGWRGREFEREKAPGSIRILGIGDSVQFGWGVEEAERYPDLLEARLRRRYPQRQWEMISLAVPGYNLVMELEVLERDGLDYDPDLILYGYTENDACLPNFVTDDADPLGGRSFLLRAIERVMRRGPGLVSREAMMHEEGVEVKSQLDFCADEIVEGRYRELAGEAALQRALERLAAVGRERDVPVVMARHLVRREHRRPSVPEGIMVVEATQPPGHTPGVGLGPAYRLSNLDFHPNAAGHEIIANRIFEALESEGIWRRLLDGESARGSE